MTGGLKHGWAKRLGYGVGPLGFGIISVPVQLFLMIYLTDTLGISPALAGIMVAAPKFWDMAVDAPIGGLADRISRRYGGRWPLLLVGVVGFPACLLAIYGAALLGSMWASAAAVTASLLLTSTVTTIFLVGHTALADDMAPEPATRTALLGARNVAISVGGIAASIAAPQLVAWGGGDKRGYIAMALVLAAVGLGPLLVSFFATRRVPLAADTPPGPALPLWKAIRATAGNRTFYALFFVLVLQGVTGSFLNAMFPYANRYLVAGGADLLSALFTAVLLATILGIPLMAWLAARIGSTRALTVATVSLMVGIAGFYIATFLPAWATVVAAAIAGLANGGYALLVQSATIDAAKAPQQGVATGAIGVYLGILFAGDKLGGSIGNLICGFLLDLAGFTPGTDMSAATREFVRTGYGLVPLLLMTLTLPLLHLAGAASDKKTSVA